jgi:hypothetical protein
MSLKVASEIMVSFFFSNDTVLFLCFTRSSIMQFSKNTLPSDTERTIEWSDTIALTTICTKFAESERGVEPWLGHAGTREGPWGPQRRGAGPGRGHAGTGAGQQGSAELESEQGRAGQRTGPWRRPATEELCCSGATSGGTRGWQGRMRPQRRRRGELRQDARGGAATVFT